MIEDLRRQALKNAVADWKKKHAIAEDDPLLATVELWEAFLASAKPLDSTLPYEEFRKSIEQLNRSTQLIVKHTDEVIQELRSVPKLKDDLWAFPYFTVVFVTIGALITGLLIGKFLF